MDAGASAGRGGNCPLYKRVQNCQNECALRGEPREPMMLSNHISSRIGPSRRALTLGTRGPFGLWPIAVELERLQTHLHLVGQSGQGKSKLMQHLLFQLVTHGWGCGVLDPHSDLAGDLIAQLASYPRRRPWLAGIDQGIANRRRVLYLDPSRTDFVVPANVLRASTGTAYDVAENVVSAFRQVYPQTLAEAPRFAQILRNAVTVLAHRGLSLLELEPFLTHASLRQRLLDNFPDSQIADFFRVQYRQWGREQVILASPVLNKVSAFLFQPAIRLSLGASENRLDFRTILDQGRILIADLGGLTGETQQLYGSLLVNCLLHSAMSRRDLAPARRRPFFAMIDEFPFFCARDTTTLGRILSQTRKFGVFLGLAQQGLGQTELSLQGSLSNCRLRCVLGSGRETAEQMARSLYRPDPQAIKHTVADADQQARSHPLFESVHNQLEVAVQEIMRLRPRQVLVKLPDRDDLLRATTPTVPPSRLSDRDLSALKRQLAQQCGRSASDLKEEIAARQAAPDSTAGRRNATSSTEGLSQRGWRDGFWQPRASRRDTIRSAVDADCP